ncbi:MAG: hypothetical protein QME71_00110 [Dehalococcoidia bacterium]|nr:hypothetical protein [Dehalococcoidia bacterium]
MDHRAGWIGKEQTIAAITADAAAIAAIKSFLAEAGARGAVRVELASSGCCDAALALRVDAARESDHVEEVDGLTFVIDRETLEIVGEVRISHADERGRKGFVVTSSNPVSEWDGFAPTGITT